MPSPPSYDLGDIHLPVAYWIGRYQGATPGVRGSINASTLLDERGEVQPDTSLRILPEHGGRTRLEGGYIIGAPELVVEITRSSRAIDLGPKLRDYERAGVLEYVVVTLGPDEVLWHALSDGRFARIEPDADVIVRSRAFPGLWLDPDALLRGDITRLGAALERGIASPEHAAFVERLAKAGG